MLLVKGVRTWVVMNHPVLKSIVEQHSNLSERRRHRLLLANRTAKRRQNAPRSLIAAPSGRDASRYSFISVSVGTLRSAYPELHGILSAIFRLARRGRHQNTLVNLSV